MKRKGALVGCENRMDKRRRRQGLFKKITTARKLEPKPIYRLLYSLP
jgi:hypothetical protein